ncbi:MAG: isochorismatase [Candidatus Ozemobacteraceae bacterium]
MSLKEFPLPRHFFPEKVDGIWRVPYQERALDARKWAIDYKISPSSTDSPTVGLLLVDTQNTFCLPDFELFVGGRSGTGAIDDNRRLCSFMYRNLGHITQVIATLDTHLGIQIFHPIFWVDDKGHHPDPMTIISVQDVEMGRWKINPHLALHSKEADISYLEEYARHYVKELAHGGKFPLMIWPYHAMLGGIGHALVSSVEEACFFHSQARIVQTAFEVKGENPLTENYSVLKPEVLHDSEGKIIGGLDRGLTNRLLHFDRLIIAGQAKSHCVAWTVADLLCEIKKIDSKQARRIYLLDDCSSPVVIPGIIDFTEETDKVWEKFGDAGMHRVLSSTPIESWPEFL